MNKLLLNNGGQPVFLDDLGVLQDLPTEQVSGIIESIIDFAGWPSPSYNEELKEYVPIGGRFIGSGRVTGCFISLNVNNVTLNTTTGIVTCQFKAGYVYVNGELLKYDATTLEIANGSPFYVIVRTEYDNQRTLDDGTRAYCKEIKRAVLSSETSTTEECYSSAYMGDLLDLIYMSAEHRLTSTKWKEQNFTELFNGMSGYVKYRTFPNFVRYEIYLHSDIYETASLESGRLKLARANFSCSGKSPMMYINGKFCQVEISGIIMYLNIYGGVSSVIPNDYPVSITFDVPYL